MPKMMLHDDEARKAAGSRRRKIGQGRGDADSGFVMSSIKRCRSGLMGLADIAKAPVSSHMRLNPTILRQASGSPGPLRSFRPSSRP